MKFTWKKTKNSAYSTDETLFVGDGIKAGWISHVIYKNPDGQMRLKIILPGFKKDFFDSNSVEELKEKAERMIAKWFDMANKEG